MLARCLPWFIMLFILAEIHGIFGGFGSSDFFVPIASYVLGFQTVLGITVLFYLSGKSAKTGFFGKGFDKKFIHYLDIAEDSKTMYRFLILTKMKAIWNLNGRDFEYFNGTIINYKIY